ncbi:engulfment and cell motility protein 1 [Lepeophtheirus salmonis]|uniref:ELMO domain-containing protein n=1 Tax=Lepeophtheirus salmonis TaxID=72036 RepID=A0A0K2UDN9_LEPSM|nr:engulfment and cell motility protein 1-like [Lepeophtheirus salmonis]
MPVPKGTTSNISCLTSSTPGDVCTKFGVELGVPGYEGAAPHFLVLSREKKLIVAIEKLMETWGLPESSSSYALQFENGFFVTEGNRVSGVENGSVLRLTHSPALVVSQVIALLEENRGYSRLEELAPDPTFIYELLKVKGEAHLFRLILEDKTESSSLPSLLNSLFIIMTKDRSWWENNVETLFSRDILLKIHSHLITSTHEPLLIPSFKILITLIPLHYSLSFEIISIPDVLRYLKTDHTPIQRLSIAMINALFKNGSAADRRTIKKEMENQKARQLIVDHIINNPSKHTKEMNHELYLLQTLLLNQLKERMLTPVASQDQSALEKIKELRKRAFNTQSLDTPNTQPRTHRYNLDYKKLGFKNDVDPTQDFRETPPGTLALDLMYSFCNHHVDQYRKLILENSCRGDEHDCPFASASIELVKLIVGIVRIGEEPLLDQDRYYPMFFTHDNPLEEFFSICILHLNKTWQEMRATTEDFSKVMDVTREQINISLANVPSTLEEFKRRLKSYGEVQKAWAEEAKLRGEREGKAVDELKKIILPDIHDLVRRQRLNYICEGTQFPKYKEKSGRYVYVKLSPNHKTLCYGDWNEDGSTPPIEKLESKIQVSELKDLIFASSSQFSNSNNSTSSLSSATSRSKNRDSLEQLSFSIYTENGKSLDLVAPSQMSFDYWTDAINALLGRPLTSAEARRDTDKILSMEIKLKLLDIEGLVIPEEEPEIPPSPTDYDFEFQA